MNRLFSAKPLVAAAIAIGALGAASVAQARSDVVFSIGINAPYGYVQPAPVYIQPAPVYVQPQPVYYQSQPVYYQSQPVYYQSQPVYYGNYGTVRRVGAWGDADRDGIPNFHDRHHNRRHGPWGDADGDGVANRYDRAPNNPYRR